MSIPVSSLLSQEETDFKKESMASSVHEVTANKNSSFLQPKAMKFGKKCVMEGVHVARNCLTCALCSSISGVAAGSDGLAVSLFKTGGVTGRGGAGLKHLYGCLFGRLLTIVKIRISTKRQRDGEEYYLLFTSCHIFWLHSVRFRIIEVHPGRLSQCFLNKNFMSNIQ